MKEPSPRASRLALTAGIIAVAAIGGGGFLLGQRAAGDRTAAPAPAPAVPAPAPPPSADVGRTLGRADLVALAASAADAFARGADAPEAVRDAVGKPFSIALPFGCGGPAGEDSDAGMRWRYDEAAGALRLYVAPVAWSPTDWWRENTPTNVEAVEGFWMTRPWTSSEACPRSRDPVVASGVEPLTLPGQTLAIGQLFGADGGRQGRRDGNAYTATLRMAPDAARGDQGYRLRIVGRVVAAPGGNVSVCRQPGGAEQRPVCMIITAFDAIAIEDPSTGQALATWPSGEPRRAN